jgi:hypothetical protein
VSRLAGSSGDVCGVIILSGGSLGCCDKGDKVIKGVSGMGSFQDG